MSSDLRRQVVYRYEQRPKIVVGALERSDTIRAKSESDIRVFFKIFRRRFAHTALPLDFPLKKILVM